MHATRANTVSLTAGGPVWAFTVQVLTEVHVYAPTGSVSIGLAPLLQTGSAVASTLAPHTTSYPRYLVPAGWQLQATPAQDVILGYVATEVSHV